MDTKLFLTASPFSLDKSPLVGPLYSNPGLHIHAAPRHANRLDAPQPILLRLTLFTYAAMGRLFLITIVIHFSFQVNAEFLAKILP